MVLQEHIKVKEDSIVMAKCKLDFSRASPWEVSMKDH